MSRFYEYMPERGDYTDPTTLDIGLFEEVHHGQRGWCICYISQTFLDGWINYVEPVLMIAVSRYQTAEEFNTKVDEFEKGRYHAKIGVIDDDVFILARDRSDGPKSWWFFGYAPDASDCKIGRFHTNDEDEVVMGYFRQHISRRLGYTYEGAREMREIDVKKLTGWVSW